LPVALSLAAALAACGADPERTTAPSPEPITVSGKVTLTGPNFEWSPDSCRGRKVLANIAQGAPVVITDSSGEMAKTGFLSDGEPILDPDDGSRADACMFRFNVGGVPAGKGSYGVEVAGRDPVQFTEAQLVEGVTLTVS